MYLYDIVPNRVKEMSIYEISEMLNKSVSTISHAAKIKRVYHDLKIAIFKDYPTNVEKKEIQNKLKLPDEYWKVINGSDGKYKVSNYGRFKRVYKHHEQFLSPYLHQRKDEMYIKLKFNGVNGNHMIKKIVAAHFLRKPKVNEVLYHANGIKTDNSAFNLQWIDRSKLAKKTGGMSRSKEVVLVDPKTMEVLEEYRSTRDTARKTPYSYQSISDYCNGVRENLYGQLFMWKEDYEKKYGEVI